jgi:uncharacterized membrane-anchored protein
MTATTVESEPSTTAALVAKVPEITAYFWIIKVLSTAMGEALSDFLDGGSGLFPVFGVVLALIAFVVALRMQFRSSRYVTAIYWFAVAMVATFGTMAADGWHQAFGISYFVSTAGYLMVLALIFSRWYSSEGTLSIHSITTRRREYFYWGTVLATFALGTAAGDMTATSLHLGYLTSAVLFAAVIAVPGLAYWKLRLNSVVAFWFAYVITRPLGASIADWMDVSRSRGGLGLGTGPVSVMFAVAMVAVVGFVAMTGRDVASRDDSTAPYQVGQRPVAG